MSRYSFAFVIWVWAVGTAAPQSPPIAPPHDVHDRILDCLRERWGRPVFWDSHVSDHLDVSVCDVDAAKVEAVFQVQHLRVLYATNAVFLTSEYAFDPHNAPFNYRWKTPELLVRPLARGLPGGREPTASELREISDATLKLSHLVPLTFPFDASQEGVGQLGLDIFVWIHKMHPGSEKESAIALLTDNSLPDNEYITGTGRIVYGELSDGHFQFRWESPLLEATMFEWGFVDLLRNGNLQIMETGRTGNHLKYHLVHAFDVDGKELSRQEDSCEAMGAMGGLTLNADGKSQNFNSSSTVCPIFADHVQILSNAKGPAELLADSEEGEKVRYVFQNGTYQPIVRREHRTAPTIPRATALNSEGMQLMQAKDYGAAAGKFEEAFQLNQNDPLFANNAGFAHYKAGRYQDSLRWFNKAIELDPERVVAYLNLGDALAKLNRNTEARQAYAKYLELAPNSNAAPDVKKKLDALPPSP